MESKGEFKKAQKRENFQLKRLGSRELQSESMTRAPRPKAIYAGEQEQSSKNNNISTQLKMRIERGPSPSWNNSKLPPTYSPQAPNNSKQMHMRELSKPSQWHNSSPLQLATGLRCQLTCMCLIGGIRSFVDEAQLRAISFSTPHY